MNTDLNSLKKEYLTDYDMLVQSNLFKDTAGCSEGNRQLGFLPAFIDLETGIVYLSRFTSGSLSPIHILDGLPAHLVKARNQDGKITHVKNTIEAGFFKSGYYYSRAAALAVSEGKTISEGLTLGHIVY